MHPNPLIRNEANGKDWKAASEAIRTEYCELHALAQTKPITAAQLKERLDAFFESDDDFILSLQIVKGIAAAQLSDKPRWQPLPLLEPVYMLGYSPNRLTRALHPTPPCAVGFRWSRFEAARVSLDR